MTDEKKTLFQRIPPIMPVLVLIAALYAAWTFYSRWSAEREVHKAAEIQAIERARKDVELNGGNRLQIRALYASPAVAHRGDSVQICYSVANAKNVSFDPAIPNVWPSMDRCVDVSPKKSTTYTLNADDGNGHSDTAQVSVQVK
jgi:hypothetical protein